VSFRFPLACVLVFCATTAFGESLEEREYWAKQMSYMKTSLDDANTRCKTTFSYDWVNKPELRKKAEEHGHSPNGICSAIVDQIDTICRASDDAQGAVKAKIKSIKCGYADKRSLSMKGGTVIYMGNNVEANFSDWAGPWLKKHL
jgi:hypothetical protein